MAKLDMCYLNPITNLRGGEEVHLEESGLQVTLFWLVSLEHFQQECGAGLHCLHFHEAVDDLQRTSHNEVSAKSFIHLIYLIDVSKWLPVGTQLHKHQGEFASGLLITAAQNLPELLQVVRLEADLLRVHDDLVELTGLREALHYLN